MTTEPSAEPCCLPNEIITNAVGLSRTVESTHHTNCHNHPAKRKEATP